MLRIKLAAVIGGLVLAFFGLQEFRVSHGSSREATAVNLADIERGTPPSNNHVQIGEHFAIYGGSVYQYSQSKYDHSAPGNSTKVTYCYYPIISAEHPFIKAVTSGEDDPDFSNISVLVKSKRFKTIGAIPDGIVEETSLQGLVVNRIESLDREERNLLRENFPQVDFEKVLIVEDGRKPASLFKSAGLVGGGGLLSLFGVALFFLGGGSRQ